ncbi:MAG: hypothetical protein M3Q42_12200 [Pseudomonadota bacterium]|nr:hypothetical protein [Pseudomonadota bacterium]
MTTPIDDSRFEPGSGSGSGAGDDLPDSLRWRLRAMRCDTEPSRELWPDIATRLQARQATPQGGRSHGRRRWITSIAVAAILLIALGAGGLWQGAILPTPPTAVGPTTATIVQREAEGLALQYNAALSEVSAAQPAPAALQPAIDELDRSLGLIHDALERDPGSSLLLDQLRRTYAHRLALAQRAVYS